MRLIDVDPLAALPVTAAAASAAFARAGDPSRDPSERLQHLALLEQKLAAVARLLERCQEQAMRLAGEIVETDRENERCSAGWPVCQRCPGLTLICTGGIGRCRRCGRATELSSGPYRCQELASVTVAGTTAAQRAMCLSHAAAAVRQVDRLKVVSAARADRAVLDEVAWENSLVARHIPQLAETPGRGRGE